MVKGSGHSFPLHPYALIGLYVLIVPATGAFYDLQPGLRACVRRGRTSSEISGGVFPAFLFYCVLPDGVMPLFLLYAPFATLAPPLERMRLMKACPWAQWPQAGPACSAGPSPGPRQGGRPPAIRPSCKRRMKRYS